MMKLPPKYAGPYLGLQRLLAWVSGMRRKNREGKVKLEISTTSIYHLSLYSEMHNHPSLLPNEEDSILRIIYFGLQQSLMSEWADGPERSLGVRKHAFKIKMFIAIEM